MLTFRIDADFHGNAFRLITDSEDLIQNIYSDAPSTAIPTIGYGYALLVKNNRNSYEVPIYLQAEFAEIGITLTQTNIDLLRQIARDLNQQNTASAAACIAQLDAQIRDITSEEARTLLDTATETRTQISEIHHGNAYDKQLQHGSDHAAHHP